MKNKKEIKQQIDNLYAELVKDDKEKSNLMLLGMIEALNWVLEE